MIKFLIRKYQGDYTHSLDHFEAIVSEEYLYEKLKTESYEIFVPINENDLNNLKLCLKAREDVKYYYKLKEESKTNEIKKEEFLKLKEEYEKMANDKWLENIGCYKTENII